MKLTIIGASGHGRAIADSAVLNGYDRIEFLDDDPLLTESGGYKVTGGSGDFSIQEGDLLVGIGDTAVRKRLSEQYSQAHMPVLCHPKASVSPGASLGKGTVVMAGAVINTGARLGRGCIVNTCSSVDHDCLLGDYVHVAVGAHLCGNVTVGDETLIGAGSIIINNISVCGGCLIGAGAVVIRDIKEPGTYVGVPARLIKKRGEASGPERDERTGLD